MIARTVLATILMASSAASHEAPTGWTYPMRCCSGIDCKMVSAGVVTAEPSGWLVHTTGELIPYNDKRVEQSPDGEFHQCARGANFNPGGHTLCLFVPNHGA